MYEGCTVEEILAFRELEGEVFDFGEGPMKIEGLLGSEDAYYEMYLQEHLNNDNDREKKKEKARRNKKSNNNKYKRIQDRKRRLKNLSKECSWYVMTEDDEYLKRLYRGSRSKFLKRQSNKKVRKYFGPIDNGGNYRKLYDFWHMLY